MLISSALVLFMIPGLAFFYGGMVRQKNVLSTMMHSFVAMGIVGVQWAVIGYSLSFGPDAFMGLIGNTSKAMLNGLITFAKDGTPVYTLFQNVTTEPGAIPEYVFAMFQCMFAIITVALISGALAERIKFSAYCLFVLLWTTLVYDPLAHWVWMTDGWLFKKGALDFAGGTVVHLSSGISALAALMFPRQASRLSDRKDGAAQSAADHARRRHALVRLVRLQCRFCHRRRQLLLMLPVVLPVWPLPPPQSLRQRPDFPGWWPNGFIPASRVLSVSVPALLPGWSSSPRQPVLFSREQR